MSLKSSDIRSKWHDIQKSAFPNESPVSEFVLLLSSWLINPVIANDIPSTSIDKSDKSFFIQNPPLTFAGTVVLCICVIIYRLRPVALF